MESALLQSFFRCNFCQDRCAADDVVCLVDKDDLQKDVFNCDTAGFGCDHCWDTLMSLDDIVLDEVYDVEVFGFTTRAVEADRNFRRSAQSGFLVPRRGTRLLVLDLHPVLAAFLAARMDELMTREKKVITDSFGEVMTEFIALRQEGMKK